MGSIKNLFIVIVLVTVAIAEGFSARKVAEKKSLIMERDSTSTREPSVQVYGLPKRFLINNGEIERVHLTTHFTVQDPDVPKKHPTLRQGHPLFQSRVEHPPHEDGNVQGHIERFAIQPNNHRVLRSADEDKEDMQAEESKVFRPLFVYRQQQVQKHQSEKNKKKIYYKPHQYGSSKSINHDFHYQNQKEFGLYQRPNSLY